MLKRYFVKQSVKEASIEDFIRKEFPLGDYSKIELQSTPLGIKIIIYTNKPGKIIGRGGRNIDMITESLKRRFELENPQIDVKEIRDPDLDARIVAKQIKSALEKGYNYKKIGNLTLNRIMGAGAIGAEIVISGKVSGSKAMTAKFVEGHLKHSGEMARELVARAYEEANTRPGKIGVKVSIMRETRDILGNVVTRREAVKEGVGKKAEAEEGKPKEGEKKKAPEKTEEKSPKQKGAKKDRKNI
jgi:small subunit ribosomal protein S3